MNQRQPKYRKDYRSPDYLVERISLYFDLHDASTRVTSTMDLRANGKVPNRPLHLDGEELELLEIRMDGRLLESDQYEQDDTGLTLHRPPEHFRLVIVTRIYPHRNKALSGLYLSNGIYCTQCEAEGFRRITYYLDRPDVLALFETTIEADASRFPVLLSNGNPTGGERFANGRHRATWRDPFRKPCYLFALVAGDLGLLEDRFTTRSGREVALRLYSEHDQIDKCHHALASLKRAMTWDEQRFDLEYDLDTYMIVAVSDFNMGAMENKGLNIFNTKYVLANRETATDDDFIKVEGVIGHEYFHNWTGNRVTCRDWFQLSLKEGLTVFRDQEFTSDLHSRPVKRIQDVRLIRDHQFPEDSSPMAHPIRPDSYIEMNNFYTVTVYNKGAEVIRMIHTILGEQGFQAGMKHYLSEFDGAAATCEDFVQAMEQANDADLSQFRRWYEQAGTPKVTFRDHHDPASGTYVLEVEQSCAPSPGQAEKAPFALPLKLGLLDPSGRALPLTLEAEGQPGPNERVLMMTEPKQVFQFEGVERKPVPSLFRDFSAPVKYQYDYSLDQLCFLLANDANAFNRWDAGQMLFARSISRLTESLQTDPDSDPIPYPGIVPALRELLFDKDIDRMLRSQAIGLPGLRALSDDYQPIPVEALCRARDHLENHLATQLAGEWLTMYESIIDDQGESTPDHRSLKNACLTYLSRLEDGARLAMTQFETAKNMNDRLAALGCVVNSQHPERDQALQAFLANWKHEPLVVDKWLAIQAFSRHNDTLDVVRRLCRHPLFDIKNPNKAYALLTSFAFNMRAFHRADGEGYRFLGEKIREIDRFNPHVAARLIRAFTNWRRFDSTRGDWMQEELRAILAEAHVSKDLYEIASKSLVDG